MREASHVVAAVGILAISASLRVWHLDLVEFKNDEAGWLRLAEDMVRLGRVPLASLESSVGVHLPALFVYFLAPIVALSRDPRVATAAVGLANAAGVGGTLLLGWRSFSPLAGLVAGLAYATNPWAVFYSRKVWNQDLLAPLTVLLFIALDQAIIANQVAWAVAAFPIFAVGVQLHPSVGVLAPLFIALIAVLLSRRHWWPLTIGVGLALLTAAPYIIHNYSTNWADLQTLQFSLVRPGKLDGEGPAHVIGLTGGWDNWYVVGVHVEHLLPGRIASLPGRVETVLLGFGIVVALVLTFAPGLAERRQRLRLGAVLPWLLLPALLTIRHGIPLHEHYFLFVLPAGALLIGIGIHWLAGRRPVRWARPVLGLALMSLIGVAAIQSLLVVRELEYLAIAYEPSYGPPLASSKEVACEVVAFGARSGSLHLASEIRTNSEPIAYLARPYFPRVEVAQVGQVGLGARLANASPGAECPRRTRLLRPLEPVGLAYADGVEVHSASTSVRATPGERVGLLVGWLANDPLRLAGNGVLWEVSLYDPTGREVAKQPGIQHDVAGLGAGEMVLSWFTLGIASEAPLGPYHFGLRRLPDLDGQPVLFVKTSGGSSSEWTSGPIDVQRFPVNAD